jgi:hypothetical protein
LISAWLREPEGNLRPSGSAEYPELFAEKSVWAELWRKELNRSNVEYDSFNINPLMALERLFEGLKAGMV